MATKKGKSSSAPAGLTDAQQEKEFKRIKAEIEKLRGSAKKGDHFTALTDDQIREKLRRTNSPMFIGEGWSGSAPVGGTISYNVTITNPDPVSRDSMYVHVFIGPANTASDVGSALRIVDARFPRLSQPGFFGLTLAPSASQSLSFSIKVPAGVEPSNYMGNAFLLQLNSFDVGVYFDRASFVFQVT